MAKEHPHRKWGSTIWRYISYWKWGFSNVMLVFRGVPSKKIHMKHHALPNLDSAGPTWRASLLEPRCAFRLARLPVCGCSGTIKTLTTIQNTIHVWYTLQGTNILLMEEILHRLWCIKPCKLWNKSPINWCRISSINSIPPVEKEHHLKRNLW